MRIIAGSARGRRLASVGKGDSGAHLRPTSDRVRESLFSVLASLGALEDAEVLDLFAGTGALGLEAVSRGADSVVFVENGRVGQKLIKENIAITATQAQARVMARDATRLGVNDGAPRNLVFLDPPYGKDLGARALHAAAQGGWLAKDALIVWEEEAQMPPPPGFDLQDTRRYGGTYITFLRFTALP